MSAQIDPATPVALTVISEENVEFEGGRVSGVAINDHLSHWIDLFRWVAAYAVVVAHGANRFAPAVNSVPNEHRTGAFTMLMFAKGFSHPGIMIFFVVSGFLVGGTAWREVTRTGGIDVRRFLTRRLIRLWIVIVPALLATLLFDTVGQMQGGVSHQIYADVRSLGLGAALCNVAFLQTVACDPYGTDGALWTLFNEFWYYMLFVAGLMLVLGKHYSVVTRALLIGFIAVVAGASLFQREGSPLIPYFLVWNIGAAAAAIPRPLTCGSPKLLLFLLVGLLLGFRIGMGIDLWSDHNIGAYLFDLGSMGVFALFLLSMRFQPMPLPRWLVRPSVTLASFSFTVYCFHVPFMNLMAVMMERWLGFGWQDVVSGLDWLRLGAQFGTVIIFCYIISLATEARTENFRKFMSGRR